MNLIFFMGTAAELIKMAPVLFECEKRKISWMAVSSGQSPSSFLEQWNEFNLPPEKLTELNPGGSNLKETSAALRWFITTFFLKLKTIGSLAPDYSSIFVVHGDTLSTLMGSIMAKLFGRKLVHIESGLNSHSVFNPFPEEIIRRICSALADSKFAPNDIAFQNLLGKYNRGKIYNTHFNTIFESLTLNDVSRGANESYVVCNIHRFENLINDDRFTFILDSIVEAAKKYRIKFFMHAQTRHKLGKSEKWKSFLSNPNIEFSDRATFLNFSKILKSAIFVITDGGSNQEECFYLGIPCLIMRSTTERMEGLDQNCYLSLFDKKRVAYFFNNLESFRRPSVSATILPSQIILNTLTEEVKEN